jgi:response regulator RpfG family c-di-GMP phosphodiesterase
MPIMDGYEAAAHIKNLPACADIPIVFITAVYHEDPHVKRGYEAGGIDYFTKPFDPELLRLKVTIYSSFRQRAAVLREREKQIQETEELLKAGRKLSAVLETLPVGVLIADTEGRICQTNDEVARICKASEAIEHDAYGELLGWWTSGGGELKDPQGPLARALRGGEASHHEKLQIRCFDGSSKSIVASASPLYGLGGRIVGAVVIIKDVSESEVMEQEIETRVARLVSLGIELEHIGPRS